MSKRRALVAGNWKMNGTLASIRPLLAAITGGIGEETAVEVVLCPPFVYIPEVSGFAGPGGRVGLGAQNVSERAGGAYTGEISAKMLKDCGCRYVIVGHSERRTLYGEQDGLVAEKFRAAQAERMTPILCVGESAAEREAGHTEAVIARQLDAVIEQAMAAAFANAVIAYEPVWAIGTGKTATPEEAEAAHAFIRRRLARHDRQIARELRILYGGSVKADNARQLFNRADIDGGLIGGASLSAEDFLAICRAAG